MVRYELAERRAARGNIDYHIELERRYYSVPYQLVHHRVEVRATPSIVEIFANGERVATHQRSYGHCSDPSSASTPEPSGPSVVSTSSLSRARLPKSL
ncbi:MAG TPA: hypothetical protein VK745_05185 [Polyangiaceae bacterium]|nr:hypothetical protein [Polyangiaceae bacterium]